MASNVTRIGLVVVALSLLVVAWYYATGNQAVAQTVRTADYPVNWTDYGLPQIENAIVRSQLRPCDNPASGVCFELDVDRPLMDVCEYYELEFGSRAWEFSPPRVPSAFSYYNEFTDGSVRVAINAMPDAANRGKTKVRLTLHQAKKAAGATTYAALRND